MRKFTIFIVAMLASGICARGSVDPRSYKNEEFLITASVPDGGTLCGTSTTEHDHGPVISLGGTGAGCDESPNGRFMELFASYSATGELVSLKKFLGSQCIDVGGGRCRVPQGQFSIEGKETAFGLVQHPNGINDVFVVTQAMIGTNVVTYACHLHTSKTHQEADIATFKEFLKNLRLP
jgi:hypothetical protein